MSVPEPNAIVWRTSSYSSNGGACVEVGWRTSSYSSNGDACVEVGHRESATLVRDSKFRRGAALTFSAPSWHALLDTVTTRAAR